MEWNMILKKTRIVSTMKTKSFLIFLFSLLCFNAKAGVLDAYPIMVQAGKPTKITMVLDKAPVLEEGQTLTLQYVSRDALNSKGALQGGWSYDESVAYQLNGSTVTFELAFLGETEHTVRLITKTDNKRKPIIHAQMKIYSLHPDLFPLLPLKGGIHMHSRFSDGRKDESPALMAATCRKLGCDFAIPTDHRKYEGSLEAIKELAPLTRDFKVYPGEEVHSPGNNVHILSLGATESMTNWFTSKSAEYESALWAMFPKIDASLPQNLRKQAAASYVIWDRIRACGGLAVYCHPYWQPENRQYIARQLSDYLLNNHYFDAMEVLNNDSNRLGILHYHELRANGKKVNGIGVTDAHASTSLDGAYTLVFAKENSLSAIQEAIRGGNCAAVEVIIKKEKIDNVPQRTQIRHTVHSNLRLGSYSYFLISNFYPRHDKVCKEEGELLLKALAGDKEAPAAIEKMQGTIPGLYSKYWAK